MPQHSPILFHYDQSPFAEKARLMIGFKRLDWQSVVVPNIPPRPELDQLTGGYRRIPVMQIGADIYCDTQLIAAELERRYPEPSFFHGGHEGIARMIGAWADKAFFADAIAVAIAEAIPHLPPAFIEDRKAMTEGGFDPERMQRNLSFHENQVRAHLDLLEAELGDERAFLLGDSPGLADIHAYMNVFIVANAPVGERLLSALPRLRRWMQRVAAIGHGSRREISVADAIHTASHAAPAITDGTADAGDPAGHKPGDRVTVTPADVARVPVTGTLLHASVQRIALLRETEDAGAVAVHFPRLGFTVEAARG